MPNYNTQLQSNNTDLQAILNSINELPEATGGIELPELTNEGSAIDLLSGKQLINSNGSVVTGTFSIDSELATQDDLIAQLSAAVNSLPDAGSGEPVLQDKTVTPTTSKQTVAADSGYDGLGTVTVNGDSNLVADNIKNGVSIFGVAGNYEGSGGSGGGSVETCTVTINPGKFGVDSGIFYYTDNNMNIQHTEYTNSAVLTVAKNTLIYIEGWSSYNTFSGSCTNLFFLQGKAVFTINGDCEFNFDT